MCRIADHEVPLRMFVHSLSQSIRQDHELSAAFLNTHKTAVLPSQFEQIARVLEIHEEKPPQQKRSSLILTGKMTSWRTDFG